MTTNEGSGEPTLRTSRIKFAGASTSPGPSRPQIRALLGLLPVALIFALLLLPTFLADNGTLRWFFGFTELAFLACAAYIMLGVQAQRSGSVRFGATGTLTFQPSLLARTLLLLVPVLIGFAGAIAYASQSVGWLEPMGSPGLRRIGVPIFLTVGVLGTAAVLIGTRRPRGLELSPTGLRWRRLIRVESLDWDGLATAESSVPGTPKLLTLHTRTGAAHRLSPLAFGSDPGAVAEVISYFQRNHTKRDILGQPARALEAAARD